jgi:hypothetical protein
MPDIITAHRGEIERLCRRFGVRRLDVFGSVLRDDFDPLKSDIDLLVEFEPDAPTLHRYFGLREALEDLLDRPVDLVMAGAVRNRYIQADIEATREMVYAA